MRLYLYIKADRWTLRSDRAHMQARLELQWPHIFRSRLVKYSTHIKYMKLMHCLEIAAHTLTALVIVTVIHN